MQTPSIYLQAEAHNFAFNREFLPQPPEIAPPSDRVSFDKKRHGDFSNFMDGYQGAVMQRQWREGIEELHNFLAAHGSGTDAEREHLLTGTEQLAVLKDRLMQANAPGSYFSTDYAFVCDSGKRSFDRIVHILKNPTGDGSRLLEQAERIPADAMVCSTGVTTNLRDIADRMHAINTGVEAATRQAYHDWAETLLLTFANTNHHNEERYAGNAVHYVNGYRNRVADRFVLRTEIDHFIPQSIDAADNVERCAKYLETAMEPARFVQYLMKQYLLELRSVFPSESFSASDVAAKIFESAKAQLDLRFGEVDPHILFEDDDNDRYTLRSDTGLLERALAHNLRETQCFQFFKSMTFTGSRQEGSTAKILGNLLFFKEYEGGIRVSRRSINMKFFTDKHLLESRSRALLIPAIVYNQAKMVEALTANGISANEEDCAGMPALHYAARKGNVKILRTLLREKANIHEANRNGYTALMAAAESGHVNAVQILLHEQVHVDAPSVANQTALLLAASKGHLPCVSALLEAGARTDIVTSTDGDNALAAALRNSRTATALALIPKTAQLDAQSKDGSTALLIAAANGNVEAVAALLAAHASVDIPDAEGLTPFMHATEGNFHTVMGMLLKHGTDVNAPFPDGATALIVAAQQGSSECVQLLISRGALLDKATPRGDTSLMAAAMQEHYEVVRLLVDAGADVQLCNDDGETARQWAIDIGRHDIADLLVNKPRPNTHTFE